MERELILNALSIFNLKEGVKIEEVRHAYFEKIDQKQFKRIILSDQHLEREFLKYHGSYLILLKHYSNIGDGTYFSNYSSDLIFKFFFNQGVYYLINRQYIKASEKLEDAYKINNKNVLLLIYIGILLMIRKNYYAAEKYFLNAITIDKDNDDAFFYLGENYYRAGKLKKAVNMFETSKNLNPLKTATAFKIKEIEERINEETGYVSKTSFISKLASFFKK
jgi:tetratricopeptide (TPR) repeat protein